MQNKNGNKNCLLTQLNLTQHAP